MDLILSFLAVVIVSLVLVSLADSGSKGVVAILAVIFISGISSLFAIRSLGGIFFEGSFPGSLATGTIPIRIDALSGWFILIINFTFLTGVFYGAEYMKSHSKATSNLNLHWICFILVHASLVSICVIQNSLAFLVAWEIMAVSAFVLVIFDHHKTDVLHAGINYLIQAHICILFLSLGFIWVASRFESFDFLAIRTFSSQSPALTSLALFLVFFAGFAFKAGFVPFHTWLPYAHPAAPAHVSGIMSGVIIKIGIYGILRMVLLIHTDYTIMGYILLVFSVITGVYGVMLAILQHNLKKLLAYHSIENIGIIGLGIGLGCLGLGSGNHIMVVFGFGGALLHTLNHSLFKSLLFFGAGNVMQSTHRIVIDELGGLVKKMPHTALLFLVASLAICGLPPFNGFISEFFIYGGMVKGMKGADLSSLFMIAFSLFGLTLIGGLALLCFTKAFGMVFLGSPRTPLHPEPAEAPKGILWPMYLIVIAILIIGIFPQGVIQLLKEPVGLFSHYPGYHVNDMPFPFTDTIIRIGFASAGFIVLVAVVFFLRGRITSRRVEAAGPTWGCGYTVSSPKLQYTASSYVRSYIKLAGPLFSIYKHKTEVDGIFPAEVSHSTHTEDKIEEWLIIYPMVRVKHFFNRLTFLQNGNPQMYILYGLLFIALVLLIPMIYDSVQSLLMFLNHL